MKSLIDVLYALEGQVNYPRKQFEIIVVDNGSDEAEYDKMKQLGGIILLRETSRPGSPYSARNRGIEIAKGEIVAFIDATCKPSPDWLQEGVKCLQNGSDIIGGRVSFNFGKETTAGKIVDSLTSVQIKNAIQKRRVAYTANIMVRKEVFNQIGMFPEGIRSGGDVRWTRTATKAGFKLVYCENAEVSKKARTLKELCQKKWRTSKYQAKNWNETGETESYGIILWSMIKPPRPNRLKMTKKVDRDILKKIRFVRTKVWLTDYLIRIIEGAGKLYGKMKTKS